VEIANVYAGFVHVRAGNFRERGVKWESARKNFLGGKEEVPNIGGRGRVWNGRRRGVAFNGKCEGYCATKILRFLLT
jgi:hypothetical protein